MGNQVYQEGSYKIYRAGNNYIVHNASYRFKEKHSHVRNFKVARDLIYFATKHIIPKNYSAYLLTSLTRISDDQRYIDHIKELIEVRKQKGKKQSYRNTYSR